MRTLAIRCSSNGGLKPSRCNTSWRPGRFRPEMLMGTRALTSTTSPSSHGPPQSLWGEHDTSPLQGYLEYRNSWYPKIKPGLVKAAADSPLFAVDRPLPLRLLDKELGEGRLAEILKSDYDDEYWAATAVSYRRGEVNLGPNIREVQRQGDRFLRDMIELILRKSLANTLPIRFPVNLYNAIEGHPLFRLILALRLQLYCRKEFRLFPIDLRYRRYMGTLHRWANNRIPIRSDSDANASVQNLDNLSKHMAAIAEGDPDLEVAIRRVSPALGFLMLRKELVASIEEHQHNPLGIHKPKEAVDIYFWAKRDISWFIDLCGDLVFLILRRGIHHAEIEFKEQGKTVASKAPPAEEEENNKGSNTDVSLDEVLQLYTPRTSNQQDDVDAASLNPPSNTRPGAHILDRFDQSPSRLPVGGLAPTYPQSSSSSPKVNSDSEETGRGWDYITEDSSENKNFTPSDLLSHTKHTRNNNGENNNTRKHTMNSIFELSPRDLSAPSPIPSRDELTSRLNYRPLQYNHPLSRFGDKIRTKAGFWISPPHGSSTATNDSTSHSFRLDEVQDLDALLENLAAEKQNPSSKPFRQDVKLIAKKSAQPALETPQQKNSGWRTPLAHTIQKNGDTHPRPETIAIDRQQMVLEHQLQLQTTAAIAAAEAKSAIKDPLNDLKSRMLDLMASVKDRNSGASSPAEEELEHIESKATQRPLAKDETE
ncbi:hypothetical protein TWF730_006326 [Orbilia blumenaviensis]|uniref:Uncharacterized protein n=1 Tax=Orbilia blumenaviensis TaxID=1796055 RepID=A0AAV9VEC8_9PEZI